MYIEPRPYKSPNPSPDRSPRDVVHWLLAIVVVAIVMVLIATAAAWAQAEGNGDPFGLHVSGEVFGSGEPVAPQSEASPPPTPLIDEGAAVAATSSPTNDRRATRLRP